MCVCVCVHAYVRVHVRECVHVCAFSCVCVCIHCVRASAGREGHGKCPSTTYLKDLHKVEVVSRVKLKDEHVIDAPSPPAVRVDGKGIEPQRQQHGCPQPPEAGRVTPPRVARSKCRRDYKHDQQDKDDAHEPARPQRVPMRGLAARFQRGNTESVHCLAPVS